MRILILIVTLVFILVFAFVTGVDIYTHGFTALSVPSVLILALFGIGILGALFNPPDK